MNVDELYVLLALNEQLTKEAIADDAGLNRLLELNAHKIEILKCIVDHYERLRPRLAA